MSYAQDMEFGGVGFVANAEKEQRKNGRSWNKLEHKKNKHLLAFHLV